MVAAGKAGLAALARLAEFAPFLLVIDFERALGQLTNEPQTQLMLTYRERYSFESIGKLTGCSVRALVYKLPAARKALAATLDRLDLL
jgi:DNA-directed RNA polymerase specialized sigma24 family protein